MPNPVATLRSQSLEVHALTLALRRLCERRNLPIPKRPRRVEGRQMSLLEGKNG